MTFQKFILSYLCVFGFVFLSLAQQQEIGFTSLTTKDGLSSNTINAILKDRFGLLWFATEDGLDKFDGTNFTVYRHSQTHTGSLPANEILSLFEDKNGNLWIGTSGGSLSLYNRKKDTFINFTSGVGENRIRNNVIRSVCSDYTGKIWVAHFDGVNILDPQTKQVSILPAAAGSAFTKTSICLYEDSRRQMWIGTIEGLFQYDPKNKSLTQFTHSSNDALSLSGDNVNTIAEDNKGNIWIGTNGGLSRLSPGQKRFANFTHLPGDGNSLSDNTVHSIAAEGEKLWIGTEDGLNIFDTRTGEIRKFYHDQRNIHSLTSKSIRCVYIDKAGIYWMGTIRGGVNKYDKNLNLFNYIQDDVFDEKGLHAPIVTAFAEGENGKVFVGTEGGGLSLFDPASKLFRHFKLQSGRSSSYTPVSILSLSWSGNKQLMVGTFGNGLFELDPKSGSYKQLLKGPGGQDLNSNDIYCITELRNGNLWVGTNGEGINVLNSDNKVVVRYTPNPKASNDVKFPINGYIRDIKEDKDGNVWIATHGGGIAVFQPASGKFTIYNTGNSKLPNDKVESLLEDNQGQIWAATFGGGLVAFNKSNRQFTTFSEKEGLQNTTVYKILKDQKGLLWVSTNQGISSIDPVTRKISNYNYHNGIQQNNFLPRSGIALSNGQFFFGGVKGFNYFNPAYFVKNTNIPVVLITDLLISNQSVAPSEDGPIQEHISVAKEINLDYKQNFAFHFVALSYTSSEQNQYAYKLEGFDKDWNYVGNTNTASYTNLDPGDYIFRVKASNDDGVWNTEGRAIKVHVHPPFWRTFYAYLVYLLLLIALVVYSRQKSIQKIQRKYALEQEKMVAEQQRRETERVHELDRLKIRFLTNLSHEFRTPISLILGPVDTLIQHKNAQWSGQLDMIKRNAKRLLNLVNQLLDFRKMEEHELRLQPTEGELVTFVKDVLDSFKDLAERKKIELVFTNKLDNFYTLFDHDKLERILFNILSNAFKFTAAGGKIGLTLEKTRETDHAVAWIALKVNDTGIGISEDKKEKIFDHFFQDTTAASVLNQGTGIGLSITKEFVKMHGGTISVDSEPGKGSTFNIELPFTHLQVPANTVESIKAAPSESIRDESVDQTDADEISKSTEEVPVVLLVEDNDDFRFYLKDNLRLQYKVVEATNGREGWQKALARHPQLIVSDINMPEMDGIELCRKIKSDKRTSHIPVILLTALTAEEDQLKGLKTGANDYITKPFNFELLGAKIKNLLVLNEKLKNTYTKQIKAVSASVEIESTDEKLLKTIVTYLEENLTNSQLSVEELSRHVGMSRSTLYNKMLELTGQTPVEYIRSLKLDKALALLEKSNMNMSQVAYSVGFSTPNYFAKSFRDKFGMLPSEYMNKMRKGIAKKDVNE